MGALKKPACIPVPQNKIKSADNVDNVISKAEIERMKRLITEKIKDPGLAKKAAMIISEMFNK